MFKHNLILIYRNFLRAKSYFLINVTGLSAGLVCTLLIYLWVRDEFRTDKFHKDDDRLFQVMEHQMYEELMTTSSTPGVLAENLKIDIPEIAYATVTTWIGPSTLTVKENNVNAKGFFVSKDYFNVFSYPLLQGNPGQVLDDKLAIVISRNLAKKLFGTDENAVGKSVEVQHLKAYHVTGVFENISPNSSYQFEFVRTFEEFKDDNKWVLEWGNNGPRTYVRLQPGTSAEAVTAKIKDYVKKKDKDDSNVTLFLKRYSDTYLYGHYENGKEAGGRIEYVRLFAVIAVFILLIACINFMNLSTARASRRAKEVGIKKSIGAQRRSLIFQYISESMVTAVLSLIIAGFIVWAFVPQFNVITDKQIVFSLLDGEMIGWFAGVAIVTGLVAGSYPAIYLSGFKPAAVLKGMMKGSVGELFARRGLVVFQFFLAVILIVSVLVIYKQIEYVQTKNLGYKKDHLILLPKEGKTETNPLVFLEEVKRIPGVVNAAAIGSSLLGQNNNTSGLSWEGKDPKERILFENVGSSLGLLETLELEFVDGRSFLPDHTTDTAKIIFNEAAIRVMGLKDPVGKVIKLWGIDREIIGVVKDFHFESLHDVVKPLFFQLNIGNTWNIMIRLEAGKEKETLKLLTDYYKTFNPGFPFSYKFQDEEYAHQYAAEQLVGTLAFYFATMAILISCLGLFGLAAFTAERRLKEIGIRKALGSSATNIVLLLSGDFTRMVLISVVLGLPASYWLLTQWLQKFAFHIELTAGYFVIAGFLALVIAWLTVGFQAIKAAGINPVECLRNE